MTECLVLDSNVLLDVYSIHDLEDALLRQNSLDDPRVQYRLTRARHALLLAIACHRSSIRCVSTSEAIGILRTKAPGGSRGLKTAFVALNVHFIMEYVLNSVELRPSESVGNRADDEFLDLASDLDATLITSEGNATIKPKKGNLLARANDRGVPALSQRDYYVSLQRNEDEDAWWFLGRFNEEAPRYLDVSARELECCTEVYRAEALSKTRDKVQILYRCYRSILRGRVRPDEPFRFWRCDE